MRVIVMLLGGVVLAALFALGVKQLLELTVTVVPDEPAPDEEKSNNE